MSEYVTDTHSLIWHLTSSPRLSTTAQQIFRLADAGGNRIFVPGIVLIEMVYLAEKGKIAADLVNQVIALLDIPNGSYAVAPLDQSTARALRFVPRNAIPDMPDRIVAATARQLDLPLMTCDAVISTASIVEIVW